MTAVPRSEKITAMKGRCCEVKSVALRISRHQRMGNISLDDLRYRFVEVNERQIGDGRTSW